MIESRMIEVPVGIDAGTQIPLTTMSGARPGPVLALDHRSLITYTIMTSSILYFQRNTTGAALISSKYW